MNCLSKHCEYADTKRNKCTLTPREYERCPLCLKMKKDAVTKLQCSDGLVCMPVEAANALLEMLEDKAICVALLEGPEILGHKSWTYKAYESLRDAVKAAT